MKDQYLCSLQPYGNQATSEQHERHVCKHKLAMDTSYIWRSGFILANLSAAYFSRKQEGHTVQFMQLQDKTMVQCAKNKYMHHVCTTRRVTQINKNLRLNVSARMFWEPVYKISYY